MILNISLYLVYNPGRLVDHLHSAANFKGPDVFAVWQRHNVEEVGTLENFLPALNAQCHDLDNLYSTH